MMFSTTSKCKTGLLFFLPLLLIQRERLLERVNALRDQEDITTVDSSSSSFSDSQNFASDFGLDCSLRDLQEEVESLKTQVKCLKRMAVINTFGSKRELRDFFADIW